MARGSFGMKLFLGVVKAIANTPKVSKPTTSRVSQSATKECPRCHYYFKSPVCPHCADKLAALKEMENSRSYAERGVAKATDYLPTIPQGYQIYKRMLYVAGITHRKEDASLFIRGSRQSLEFELEPNNPKDKNAIKLIGVTPTARYFVGYVPKEISKALIKTGLLDKVEPRLDRTYHGIKDYVEIRFQIIGLKKNKKQFDAFLNPPNKPADAGQKLFYKFFELPIPKGLTAEQATKNINEYREKIIAQNPSQYDEYNEYLNILEEFDDKEFRSSFEVKKTSMAVLNEALYQLKQEGNTYADLHIEIENVVDRVIKLKPELGRKRN